MVIGFIVIFQAMYTAVMERTREIGILKSMGASKLYIVNVVLRETVLLALGGIVLGIVVSLAARAVLAQKLPLLQVIVSTGMDCARCPDCHCRRHRRRAVSGVQGGAEGSHRRAGLRIEHVDLSGFAFDSPTLRAFSCSQFS